MRENRLRWFTSRSLNTGATYLQDFDILCVLIIVAYQFSCLTKLVMASQQALDELLHKFLCATRFCFTLGVPLKLCRHYLCQIGVFGLLLQKINKAHAKLHHKVSQLRLESLVELVGVSPHQLVHRLGHAFQTGLWSIGVAPGLFQDKPVDSFEVLPKLQPARLQSFGLLTRESVRPWQIL